MTVHQIIGATVSIMIGDEWVRLETADLAALTAPASLILAGDVAPTKTIERAIADAEVIVIGGTSRITPAVGLLASLSGELECYEAARPAQKYGNPRPYLKRKKGRS